VFQPPALLNQLLDPALFHLPSPKSALCPFSFCLWPGSSSPCPSLLAGAFSRTLCVLVDPTPLASSRPPRHPPTPTEVLFYLHWGLTSLQQASPLSLLVEPRAVLGTWLLIPSVSPSASRLRFSQSTSFWNLLCCVL
jgi:hypothetical protein